MADVFQRINYLHTDSDNLTGFSSIVFNNLDQLIVRHIEDENLVAMSTFEFPKLQSLRIHNYYGVVIDENLLKSFFNKIKYIKTLEFPFTFKNPNVINLFENLLSLEFYYLIKEDDDYERLIKWIDMPKHRTLERIKIEIDDYVLNVDIFDVLINLRRAKPNVEFDIEIETHTDDRLVFQEYKNRYKQAKHKINVKLISSLDNPNH